MNRHPPRYTRTATLFPYTTLFRSTCKAIRSGPSRAAGFPFGNSARRASGYSGGVVDRKDQNVPFPASVELTHLDRLEAESIHIMREVMADAAHPVMLYSVGKDSAVMLHLRSEEHTSELQSLMRISYAVFCLKKKNITITE